MYLIGIQIQINTETASLGSRVYCDRNEYGRKLRELYAKISDDNRIQSVFNDWTALRETMTVEQRFIATRCLESIDLYTLFISL